MREGPWRGTFEQRPRGVKDVYGQAEGRRAQGTAPGWTRDFSVSAREPGGSWQDAETLSLTFPESPSAYGEQRGTGGPAGRRLASCRPETQGLEQEQERQGGKKWSGAEHVVKVEPLGLAHGLDEGVTEESRVMLGAHFPLGPWSKCIPGKHDSMPPSSP